MTDAQHSIAQCLAVAHRLTEERDDAVFWRITLERCFFMMKIAKKLLILQLK